MSFDVETMRNGSMVFRRRGVIDATASVASDDDDYSRVAEEIAALRTIDSHETLLNERQQALIRFALQRFEDE